MTRNITTWVSGKKDLRFPLISLTILFIFAQLSIFLVNYQVGDLMDSLASSPISHAWRLPSIFLPVAGFMFIQCIAYALFILWIWFITHSCAEVMRLTDNQTYSLGLVCWLMACLALITLNQYAYPNSLFAHLMPRNNLLTAFCMWSTTVILSLATAVSLLWFIRVRHFKLSGYLVVCTVLIMSMAALHTRFLPFPAKVPNHATSSSRPNVIIIGLDSLRPDFISYFGEQKAKTPNIDHFLQHATTFTAAYTPLARTFPSWVGLLTGNYPLHTGARANLTQLSASVQQQTLAHRLRAAGYFTIYGIDEPRFSNITPDYGFDRLIGPKMGATEFILGSLSDFPLTNLLVNSPLGSFLFPYNYANRGADITYEPDTFLRLIQQGLTNRPDQPVFLALHLCLAHWPFTWARDGQSEAAIEPQRYASSVAAVDAQLGKLLQLLSQAGLMENSLLVLWSDHGTALGLPNDRLITAANYRGEQRLIKKISINRFSAAPVDSVDFQHDYSINTAYGQGNDILSAQQYQILLAMQGAGLPTKEIPQVVSNLDVAPTILARLNLPPLTHSDGQSLQPYLVTKGKPNHSSHPLFFETADTIQEMESNQIHVATVVHKMIGAYAVDNQTGRLLMTPEALKGLIASKQRAVMEGGWLLVHYPRQYRMVLNRAAAGLQPQMMDDYYVLVDLVDGHWGIDLSSTWAKQAPVAQLLGELKRFYQSEEN